MKCIDATVHLVFDDEAPSDWNAPLAHPAARGLSLAEFDRDDFSVLATALGEERAAAVAHQSGLDHRIGPWGGWRSRDGLRATFARAHDPKAGDVTLVACVGEFQPARWIARVLSVWNDDTSP